MVLGSTCTTFSYSSFFALGNLAGKLSVWTRMYEHMHEFLKYSLLLSISLCREIFIGIEFEIFFLSVVGLNFGI